TPPALALPTRSARPLRRSAPLSPIKENLTCFDLPGDQLVLDRRKGPWRARRLGSCSGSADEQGADSRIRPWMVGGYTAKVAHIAAFPKSARVPADARPSRQGVPPARASLPPGRPSRQGVPPARASRLPGRPACRGVPPAGAPLPSIKDKLIYRAGQ